MSDPFLPIDPMMIPPPPGAMMPMAPPPLTTEGLPPVDIVPVGPKRRLPPQPAPELADVLADKEDMLALHKDRMLQTEATYRQLAARRNDRDIGHFEDDEEDIDAGEIEVFPLLTLVKEHQFNVGMISQMETYIEHQSRERIDDEEILAIEDACYYARQCFARQYEDEYHSSLTRAKPATVQYTGALVSMMTVDPDEPCGVRYSFVDPMTIFPVTEGPDGLSDLWRVYQNTAARIIGAYRDEEGEVEAKVGELIRNKSGRAARNEPLEVTEYWSRDHVQLVVQDKEIFTREHGIGKVPFILTLGSFEIPQGVAAGSRSSFDNVTSEPGWHHSQMSSQDIAAQWRPWSYGNFQAHAINEAVAGRTLTEFKRSMFRPMVYEFDPLTRNQDAAELSQYTRAVNRIPLGNKLSVLPTSPDGPTLAMTDKYLSENANQGLWSQIRAGQIPPQTPSAALGTMFDLGGADRSAITDAITLHDRRELEFYLELVRDFGPVMGQTGQRGMLMVPSQDPQYQNPFHLLTPDMIERAGTHLNVSMHVFRPDPAMAQFLTAMLGAGLSSPETALRRARYVPDPMRELQRIRRAMIEQTPEVATQLAIMELGKEIDRAVAEKDFESADAAMVAQIQMDWNAFQQMMAGSAPPKPPTQGGLASTLGSAMGAGAPAGGGGAGPAAIGSPITQQGLSLTPLGIGAGRNGGRPMGTMEPRSGLANTNITVTR